MAKKKERKGLSLLKDGKLSRFIDKAKAVFPDVAEVGLDVLMGKNPVGAIRDKLEEKKGQDERADALLREYYKDELEYDKELTALDVQDRADARARQVALVKLGQFDLMFYLSGIIGLGAFGFCVYALIYVAIPEANRELFIHMLGIIEGIAISIFSFHFGSSKSSKDKTKTLEKALDKQ